MTKKEGAGAPGANWNPGEQKWHSEWGNPTGSEGGEWKGAWTAKWAEGGEEGGEWWEWKWWSAKPSTVPASVMMEEKNKRREAEAKLAKYEEAEAKRLEEKQLAEGKQEEVIATKQAEIDQLKAEVADLTVYKTKVGEIAEQNLNAFKEAVDDEVFNDAITISWIDPENPGLEVLEKLPALNKRFWVQQRKWPSWWSDMQKGWWTWHARYLELEKKAKEQWPSSLSRKEKDEYLKLGQSLAGKS